MKGIAPIVIVAIVAALAVEASYLSNLVLDTQTVRRTAREVGIIDSINTVEFAKRSLEQSAAYSFYQSAYEIAKGGGYLNPFSVRNLNGFPYWRYYADTTGFPSNYVQTLSDQFLKIFKWYTGNLTIAKLTIPDYTSVAFPRALSPTSPIESVTVLVFSLGKLNFDNTPLVQIFDVADVSREIETIFFKMFDNAKQFFVNSDSIRSALIAAINAVGFKNYDATTQTSTGSLTVCGREPTAEEVFIGAKILDDGLGYSSAIAQIKANIPPQIAALEQSLSSSLIDYDISIKETAANVVATTCTVTADDSCGSKVVNENLGPLYTLPQTVQVSRPPVVPGSEKFYVFHSLACGYALAGYTVVSYVTGTFQITSSPFGTGGDIVVLATYQPAYLTKTCTFSFYAAAKVTVAEKDLTRKFPVYDGTTDFRNVVVNFAVLSCNVYDQLFCKLT